MAITMDSIMGVVFSGDGEEEIRVSFKKTVSVKPYETEVVESEAVVKVPKGISSIERMIYIAVVQAQIQYEVYLTLALKGYVTQDDLNKERDSAVQAVNMLLSKAEDLGKSIRLSDFR